MYHIAPRWNERKDIYRDIDGRERFLETLQEMLARVSDNGACYGFSSLSFSARVDRSPISTLLPNLRPKLPIRTEPSKIRGFLQVSDRHSGSADDS